MLLIERFLGGVVGVVYSPHHFLRDSEVLIMYTVQKINNKFYMGNIELLKSENKVSVAGARKIDSSSTEWLKAVIKNLDSDCVIVSGLALGADTVAHKTALESGLKQIAVLPSGFNRITPQSNHQLALDIVKDGGLLVSEYHPRVYASRHRYINRNKIIARLGNYLIVPQFEVRSGTRHTVNFAKKLNKQILVQDADYSGNQFIIKDSGFNTIIQ